MDKAFVAFSCDTEGKNIATGNWGCGAFNGSPQYKAIIQYVRQEATLITRLVAAAEG